MNLIELKNITKKYNGKTILDNINLKIRAGESVAIIGFSGAGKSTALKIISGLETPNSGEVILGDENIGMAFQYSALFDFLTVDENIAFSLKERKEFKNLYTDEEIQEIVAEKLEIVGLSGIEKKYPNELSGGMQKRVGFARAIVTNPKIILYDEPTAGLDPVSSTMIEDYIVSLKNKLDAASVIVTHQLSTIKRTADKVVMLYNSKIVFEGSMDEFFKTENDYARQFIEAKVEGPMTVAGI